MEMNLIDKLDVKDGNVDIQYHATTPYCPPVFALKISQDLKSNLLQVKGVKGASVMVTGHYLSDAVNKQVNKPAPAPPTPSARPPPTAPPATGGGGTAGFQDTLLFALGGAAVLAGAASIAYRRKVIRKR